MDDELITQTQKPFKFYIQDIKSEKIDDSGNVSTIFLKGFPYDEGALRNGMRAGLDRGPSFINYELKNSGLYPFDNIEKIKIYDAGDIEHSFIDASIPLEKAHDLLQESTIEYLKIQNSAFCAIGGSQDMVLPLYKGLIEVSKEKKLAIINVDARFDVLISNKGTHSGSYLREILGSQDLKKSLGKLVNFGAQGSQCLKSEFDYLKKNDAEVYWLDKNIRKQKSSGKETAKTQAGALMIQIIESLKESKIEDVLLTFDISSINSNVCPGVSYPSVVGGISFDEAKEISFIAGASNIVKIFNLSEFNPAVEMNKTSKLCVSLLYEFTRGIALKK